MSQCQGCKLESNVISEHLHLCASCIKTGFDKHFPQIEKTHAIKTSQLALEKSKKRDGAQHKSPAAALPGRLSRMKKSPAKRPGELVHKPQNKEGTKEGYYCNKTETYDD